MESSRKKPLPKNPSEESFFWSAVLCCWTLPNFIKGYRKNLEINDLYESLKSHKSEKLGDKMSGAWERQILNYRKTGKKPRLWLACWEVFGLNFTLQGVALFFMEFVVKIAQPLFLGQLVLFYERAGESNIIEAYLYAAGIIGCSVISVLFMHPYMLNQVHLGMKTRVAVCSLIYRKSLRLSKSALGDTTAGQIVNLLANDVGRLDIIVIFIHYLWIGPLQTIFVTYFMYQKIGVSALAGVLFMAAFIPLQVFLGKQNSKMRLKTALRTDERVRLMNEIVQGIQVIKMYAWEKPFGKVAAFTRMKELKFIKYISYIRGTLLSLTMFISRVSIFMSLVMYALLGQVLTAEQAFVTTAFYNVLKQTMTIFFPNGVSIFAETLVSFRRIEKFLLSDETLKKETEVLDDQSAIDLELNVNKSRQPLDVLELNNVKAKWIPGSSEYTLDGISFNAKKNSLIAVIGPVGSGKSSLIQAILGELPIESGYINVNGTVSYASQEPWLFTGTVRQNILFGQPLEKDRYRTVVKKCALERDFQLLPNGDKTIVGERGTSLSGGQKARISLARAVYRDCSVYLLDDPLSAVDTHVGRHLFDQCMKDYLRDRLVVLITHQLQFLEEADHIIILEHGKVVASGSFESLRKTGVDFAKLLAEPEKKEIEESVSLDRTISISKRSTDFRHRLSSIISVESVDVAQVETNPMEVEERIGTGNVGLKLYRHYFTAGGGYCIIYFMLLFCVLAQLGATASDFFLTYWVNKNKIVDSPQSLNSTERALNNTEPPHDDADADTSYTDYVDIYIFTGLVITTVILTLSRTYLFFNLAITASKRLYDLMFRGLILSPLYFFNTNPSGRILNRFSRDIGQVDEILPGVMIDVIQIFLQLIAVVILVATINVYLLIPTIVIAIVFYFVRKVYLASSRNLKRLEAITRSPIYSHLGASITGLSTIRAFGAQKVLAHEFDQHQNLHSSAFYMFLCSNIAFGFTLDCCCVVYIAIVTLSFFSMGSESGGNVGLAITQAMALTGMVQWGMKQSAELENTMTSVERVVEYDRLDPEGDLESSPNKKPPKDWPQRGQIVFNNVSMSYFPNGETVLKSLNFEILPGEKVGIVGRTGAGKSSLINAIFRLSYNEGSVLIDGIEINAVGLHDLRSKISIIPQEPVLFSGTMRYNLDPFDEYSDASLWQALDEVKLKEAVSSLGFGLQSKIAEGGSNFSVGQRQLVCLARALLRENKILLMDEATANVDPLTDVLIQTTIRNKFVHCTVLTIAHRLNTVIDSDKVLVMDAGQAVEFGTPHELLTESHAKVFHGMVLQTGKATHEMLFEIAKQTYYKSHKKNNVTK